MKTGPTALGEVLHKLHETASKRDDYASSKYFVDVDVQMLNEWTSGLALLPDVLVLNVTEAGVEPRLEDLAVKKEANNDETNTAMENLLLRFVTKDDRLRFRSKTLHLMDAKRSQILHDACVHLSRRIVHDIGWRAGTEFGKMHGEELVKAVLLRARDTAKGLQAVTEDTLKLSMTLRDAVIVTRDAAPRVAAANKMRMRMRANLPSWLNSYGRGDLVDNVWRAGTDVVGVITEVPWRATGLMLNLLLCGNDENALQVGSAKEKRGESPSILDVHHAAFNEWGGGDGSSQSSPP